VDAAVPANGTVVLLGTCKNGKIDVEVPEWKIKMEGYSFSGFMHLSNNTYDLQLNKKQ
jgi:hypothetical protein